MPNNATQGVYLERITSTTSGARATRLVGHPHLSGALREGRCREREEHRQP